MEAVREAMTNGLLVITEVLTGNDNIKCIIRLQEEAVESYWRRLRGEPQRECRKLPVLRRTIHGS